MSKIKYHDCKSLKEFNKINRKYIKYFGKRWDNYPTKWYVWLSYKALDNDLFSIKLFNYANKLALKGYKNLSLILKEAKDNYNYSFTHKNGKQYRFSGIEITNEDYYWVFSNGSDNICSSCVGDWKDVIRLYGCDLRI